MKKFRRLLPVVLIISIFSVVMLASCGTKIKEGFDYDLANAVGEKIGIKFVPELIEWKNKEILLASKKIDAIWNGFTITEARKENILFSQPYMQNQQVIVVRTEDKDKYSTIESIKKLNKEKVAVEAGSAGEDVLKTILGENNYTKAQGQIDAINFLRTKNFDLIIIDKVMANYYRDAGNTTVAIEVITEIEGLDLLGEEYGIGYRKNDVYTKYMIDKALYELQEEGKLLEIAKKYKLENVITKIEKPVEPTEGKEQWEALKKKGKIKYGCTVFMPMAGLGSK